MQNISANLDAAQKKSLDLAYEKYNRNQVLNETRQTSDLTMNNREMSFKEKQLMISKRGKYKLLRK